jgi:hypothetical protein
MKNPPSSTAFRYRNLSVSLANPCTQPSKCPDVSTPPMPRCTQPSKCPDVSTPPMPGCTQPSKCPDVSTPGPKRKVQSSDLNRLQTQLNEMLQQL